MYISVAKYNQFESNLIRTELRQMTGFILPVICKLYFQIILITDPVEYTPKGWELGANLDSIDVVTIVF